MIQSAADTPHHAIVDFHGHWFPPELVAAPLFGHLYIDTMGFDPAATRYAIDALGPENVLIGSDWPIVARPASVARVDALLAAVDVTAEQAVQISHGTALRLLSRDWREASAVS